MITFSKNSFHYRFHKFYERNVSGATSDRVDKIQSLCPYFWLTFFRAIFLPIFMLSNLLTKPIPKTPYIIREYDGEDIKYLSCGRRFEMSIVLGFAGAVGGSLVVGFLLSPIFCLAVWFMVGAWPEVYPIAVAASVIYAVVLLILLFSIEVVLEFIKSSFKKVCPKIIFSEDTNG